jgi:Na+/melibiose symporter-like transporter
MIDQKFQPNPVVPKPKLPKATVINLNPNYQKQVGDAADSKKIIVTVQKDVSKPAPETLNKDTPQKKVNEKNTALFDFKKILNSGIEQSKSIIQNTAEVFKNVENKIQSRFKNEIISLDKSNNEKYNRKVSEPKKEKKKLFEIPKFTSKKSDTTNQKDIKSKKNLPSQVVILTGCFAAIFAAITVIFSFQGIINGFAADLKILQWILVLFFLTNSVFSFFAKDLIQSKGAKSIFFDGLTLVILGLLIAIMSPNIVLFVFAISVIFGFGFGCVFAVASELFCYNSGFSRIEKSNILYNKSLVGILILSSLLSNIISFYFGWKWTLGTSLVFCLLALLNLNRISEIKEKSKVAKANLLEIILFAIANLLISFGIIESLYYGWFNAKNSIEILGRVINPRISISIIALLLGIFVLAINNFIKNKTIFSIKKTFERVVSFIKSGFLGGMFSLFVFGAVFFVLLATKSNLIQAAFGTLPIFLGLLISTFLTRNLANKISYKNTQLLGLIIYILGLIMVYFSLAANITLINLFSPFFLVGLGAGLFQFVQSAEMYKINFKIEYSKMFSLIIFGLAFFWSFSSSNFSLTTSNSLIPETLKPDLFTSISTIKNLNVCKFDNPNKNNPSEFEVGIIRAAICDNFTASIVEGSKTVVTLAAVISVLCSFVVMIEREKVLV